MGFGSMYIGATGVKAYSDGMQVVGNNLANVNTIGYRKADIHFNSLMYSQMATGTNRMPGGVMEASQMGKGVGVAAVLANFRQSAMESSNEVTDIAIEGHGFFGVSPADTSDMYYTRAGDFRFDQFGYLTTSHGHRLQGYEIDRDTGLYTESITDIQLPMEDVVVDGQTIRTAISPPRETSEVTMITNLDRNSPDTVTSSSNPFFALFNNYSASNASPFGNGIPAYSSSLKVYDENGASHALSIYYDPVSTAQLSNAGGGETFWEFAVAIPSSEDGRAGFQGTSQAGLLALGTMTFGPDGALRDISAFTADAPGSLSNWSRADLGLVSSNGMPMLDVAFVSSNGATAVQSVGLNFGVTTSNTSWAAGGASNAAGVGTNVDALPGLNSPTPAVANTTSYDNGSRTEFMDQDGYTEGYLRSVSISTDGYLEGFFTNGETERLARITLFRFQNNFGLRREGSNLFSATPDSGTMISGGAGDPAFGTTNQNSLEMSNADMAEEFAKMIMTQRSFQSNTKVITTSDSILNTTINVKR
ncbi:flagellar hook protein FlgE [Salidesulfovibrio brasiliensis]|uniref:flagellar hook protein FlgE n=1 Tax=Salidesulfovibrio brasiliensis TaxID=221711 RepID=UPI0006D0F98C|nr:flagellar hook-basal body complex protein [Salidesulfovibrio brasiliensis]